MEEKDYVILRTYNTVWKIDRKIYSFEGLKLLFPISLNQVFYIFISIIISYLLVKVVPFYNKLNFVIKYVIIPYGLMKFFTKQKLDGKLPHKFFLDYLIYFISPKKYARFQVLENIKIVKFDTPIIYREKEILNKTEITLNKIKKRWGK